MFSAIMLGMTRSQEKPLLSIVIPVFNAEKYIVRCLKSIARSAEKAACSTEVLIIDNGSSDNSKEVSNNFIHEHRNKTLALSVLECQTPGAAAARNFGVGEATGKYLWFVDADDEISDDAIFLLITTAKKNDSDVVMMGAKRIYPNGHTDYLSAVDPSRLDYKSRFVRYGMGPWQVIMKRSWWNKNFQFKEGIIHEDMELMSSLILYTDKLSAVDKPLYLYHQTRNSVLHRSSWSEHAYDIFPALEGLYGRFKATGAEKRYHDELEWFFIWNLLIDSAADFAAFPEGKPGFKRSREMLSKYFPNWRKNRFLKEKPIKFRIRVRMNYYR